MEYRHLGSSGLRLSALSFGAWVTFGEQYGVEGALECMRIAVEAGVNFFDNAEAYADGRAEEIMGEAIRRGGWKRSDLVISTKIFWGGRGPNQCGLSRKHVVEGLRDSLDRLQMEYVDLVFCHRPDLRTPVEETVRAMHHVVDRGLAFYWGTSEWSAEEIRRAWEFARREHLTPPTMEQPEYHMFQRDRVEREYLPLYGEIGLGTTIWSPLASGLLTGKYNQGLPGGTRMELESLTWLRERLESDEGRRRLEVVRHLEPLARRLDCSLAQLAIAWCLKNPLVSTVITGASKPEQLRENLGALEVVDRLGPGIIEEIEQLLQNRPAAAQDWRPPVEFP